jgi:hypothetical protein
MSEPLPLVVLAEFRDRDFRERGRVTSVRRNFRHSDDFAQPALLRRPLAGWGRGEFRPHHRFPQVIGADRPASITGRLNPRQGEGKLKEASRDGSFRRRADEQTDQFGVLA